MRRVHEWRSACRPPVADAAGRETFPDLLRNKLRSTYLIKFLLGLWYNVLALSSPLQYQLTVKWTVQRLSCKRTESSWLAQCACLCPFHPTHKERKKNCACVVVWLCHQRVFPFYFYEGVQVKVCQRYHSRTFPTDSAYLKRPTRCGCHRYFLQAHEWYYTSWLARRVSKEWIVSFQFRSISCQFSPLAGAFYVAQQCARLFVVSFP